MVILTYQIIAINYSHIEYQHKALKMGRILTNYKINND